VETITITINPAWVHFMLGCLFGQLPFVLLIVWMAKVSRAHQQALGQVVKEAENEGD